MQTTLGLKLPAFAMALGLSLGALAGNPSGFERITTHYEEIRQALLHDSNDGVARAAGQIRQLIQRLEADLSETAAGTRPGSAEDLRAVLPSIRDATDGLAKAGDITHAREAFGALSKAMVRYRRLVSEPSPVVVFCSMAQKVWLQPEGEIGNPYYGQRMARCGEIVSD